MTLLLILFGVFVPILIVGAVRAARRVAVDDADIEALARGLQPANADPAVLLLSEWSTTVRADAP